MPQESYFQACSKAYFQITIDLTAPINIYEWHQPTERSTIGMGRYFELHPHGPRANQLAAHTQTLLQPTDSFAHEFRKNCEEQQKVQIMGQHLHPRNRPVRQHLQLMKDL